MISWRHLLIPLMAITAVITLGFYQHAVHGHLPPPERLNLSVPRVIVPLTFFGGRPVVDVKVNGKGPFRFIFDTGAAGNVIGEDLAHELNLPALQTASMGRPGSDKPLPATVTRLAQIEIGGAVAEGVSGVYSDLTLLRQLSVVAGQQTAVPRGILSATSFPGWVVGINFPAAQLEMEPGELPVEDNKTIFHWNWNEPLPSVPLKMGKLTLDAKIDSGSGSGITLSTANAAKLPLTQKHLEEQPARFVDSQFPVTTAKLNQRISIGSIVLTDPTIRFHDGSASANVGQEVLKSMIVRVDAKNRRVQLIQMKEIGKRSSSLIPKDQLSFAKSRSSRR